MQKHTAMKAAVIHAFGDTPRYETFPDPVAQKGEVLVDVKACVLENFDKVTANGTHYSSKSLFPAFPAVVGTDGVGTTVDGQLVSFGKLRPPYGAFAEKAAAGYIFPIPGGIDPAKAAAIPPSALTSLLPLKHKAALEPGETVLVNGATGVSGRIAIQIAKLLGAGKIVGTGRNHHSLELLPSLGADAVIDLKLPAQQLSEAFIREGGDKGYDVVIDFLWGTPAEILINTFIPSEAGFPRKRIRYVQIGDKAGSHIALSGTALRTSGLELMGIGHIAHEVLSKELNQVWEWLKENKLDMDIDCVPLSDISAAWQRTDLAGKRLVVMPQ